MPHCEYNVLYDKEDIILQCTEKNDRYPFVNLPLPYSYSALEPYIDTETMRLHHDAHLGTYIKNLNAALAGEPSLQKLTLTELIFSAPRLAQPLGRTICNNAGGVYNHRLYFDTLTPPDCREPEPVGELGTAILRRYGNYGGFYAALKAVALSVFGSGYAFLTAGACGLSIVTGADQNSPLTGGSFPILALDVWEHAYYLLHHNLRADYIDSWLSVVDWRTADERYRRYIKYCRK